MNITTISLLLLFSIFFPTLLSNGETYNVIDFGAQLNPKIDSSKAFLSAWKAACNVPTNSNSLATPTTIYVPRGRYLIRNVLTFSGHNCKSMTKYKGIVLRLEGTLVASEDFLDLENEATAWLVFDMVAGVTISGGWLDFPCGAKTLAFTNSRDITINGLRTLNNRLHQIVVNRCKNVTLQGRLSSLAPRISPSTNGRIHVHQSPVAVIRDLMIAMGDNCVSVEASTKNLAMEIIVRSPSHGIRRLATTWSPEAYAKEYEKIRERRLEYMIICSLILTLISLVLLCCCNNEGRYTPRRLSRSTYRKFPLDIYLDDREVEFVKKECVICISDYEDGDLLQILPSCRHNFHSHCIAQWFNRDCRCPICRHDYFEKGYSIIEILKDTICKYI